MNRLLLVLVLLVLCLPVMAQQCIPVRDGEITTFHILIPWEYIIFSAQSQSVRYELNVHLYDGANAGQYQNAFDLKLRKDDVVPGTSLLISFDMNAKPIDYKLRMILHNRDLGDKRQADIHVKVPSETDIPTRLLIIADNGRMRFVPTHLKDLSSGLKDCYIPLGNTALADSIRLVYTIDGKSRYTTEADISADKKLSLMPILQQDIPSQLLIQYFHRNILYEPSLFTDVQSAAVTQEYSLEDQLAQIRYIANQNEWKQLRNMAKKDIATAINNFWEMHNPQPGDRSNPAKEVFYDRVREADRRFTIHKKLKGWRSDRGRIYIKYGEPDEIENSVYPIGYYPYIIWYYYRENRVFRFIDKTGFGDYVLVEDYYGED